MINKNFNSRGDTLIEVLSAITIFSLIAISTLTIMNKGTSVAQRSLEITQARYQIDAQAEALRFLNSSYIVAHRPNDNNPTNYPDGPVKEWLNIRNNLSYTTSSLTSDEIHGQPLCPTNINSPNKLESKHFVLNTSTAKVLTYNPMGLSWDPDTFSQVHYDNNSPANITNVDGIWIEAITSNPLTVDVVQYIDFNIWTCWYSPGQTVPVTISTKVRLYDPR